MGAQISALQRSVSERGRAILEMDGEIHALRETAAKHKQELERQKKHHERELESERQFIVGMFVNSFSWRLTAPIRTIAAACRKAKSRFLQILGRADKDLAGAAKSVLNPATVCDEKIGRDEQPHDDRWRNLVSTPRDRSEILECAIQDVLDRPRMPGSPMDGYVHRVADRVDTTRLDLKAIAFYIPHFYSTPGQDQNQETESCDDIDEWSRLATAVPRYLGHYQPHLPVGLGFYDLRLPDVMRQQIDLARQYGIFGFCFHHCWYEEKERFGLPFRQFLADPKLRISFCVCWENGNPRDPESSTSNIPQASADPHRSDLAFLDSMRSAFLDSRYIRVKGKPLIIILRANELPDPQGLAQRWRQRIAEMGLPGLYLVGASSCDLAAPSDIGFDAVVEYPPCESNLTDLLSKVPLIDAKFSGCIRSYSEIVEKEIRLAEQPLVKFKTVMTGWDDESRKPGAGHSFTGSTPALYGKWLRHACEIARLRPPEERLVFINAWNDWTNGAHLEPDRRYGYAYLHVTANVLRNYHNDPDTRRLVEMTNAAFTPTSKVAIILHCHYEDLIGPVFERYLSSAEGADLFITTRHDLSMSALEEIRRRRPNVFIQCEENRGRDIRPFLFALRRIQALGYKLACKIHTKKAPHLAPASGEQWRQRLMEPLLGSSGSVARAVQQFSEEPNLGLLAPQGSIMDLRRITVNMFNTFWLNRLLNRMNRPDLIGNYSFQFPAGSMFWFRVAALAGLDELILAEDDFEEEYGQTDGTLAHAVERLVALFAEQRGYSVRGIS